MTLEEEFFSGFRVIPEKLEEYGFFPEDGHLTYRKSLPEGDLEIRLVFDGTLRARVMDTAFEEEYTNYRLEGASGFSGQIRQELIDLLTDVRDRCFENLRFRSEQLRRMSAHIREVYGILPDFPWEKYPTFAVFRHPDSRKMFVLAGSVPRNRIDRSAATDDEVDVINVKVVPGGLDTLLAQKGYFPAYHMNKQHWVTLILDDTLPDGEVEKRIRESFENT